MLGTVGVVFSMSSRVRFSVMPYSFQFIDRIMPRRSLFIGRDVPDSEPLEKKEVLSADSSPVADISKDKANFRRSPVLPLVLSGRRRVELTNTGTEKKQEIPNASKSLVWSCRKYFFESKTNTHIHILSIAQSGIYEVIVYDTEQSVEAPHLYLDRKLLYSKINDTDLIERVDKIKGLLREQRRNIPQYDELLSCVLKGMIVAYLLDRISIYTTDPFRFVISEDLSITRDVASSEVDTDFLNSAIVQKPSDVEYAAVSRAGKSQNIIGKVENLRITINSISIEMQNEILEWAMLKHFDSEHLKSRFRFKGSTPGGASKMTTKDKKVLRAFEKFGTDEDILLESLSFIHISEFLIFGVVCTKWRRVLQYGLSSMVNVSLTSRYGGWGVYEGANMNQVILRKTSRGRSPFFVSSATVAKVLSMISGPISSLKLDYLVINEGIIASFASFSPDIEFLSIGTIKYGPNYLSVEASDTEGVSQASIVDSDNPGALETSWAGGRSPGVDMINRSATPHRPEPSKKKLQQQRQIPVYNQQTQAQQRVASRGGRVLKTETENTNKEGGSHGRPVIVAGTSADKKNQKRAIQTADNESASGDDKLIKSSSPMLPIVHPPVQSLPFVNGENVLKILKLCGEGISKLELNVGVGALPEGFFKVTPHLMTLVAIKPVMSQAIYCARTTLEGAVTISHFKEGFKLELALEDFLQLLLSADREALLLTDRRGNVVAGNDAWEKMCGYKSSQVHMLNWSFLRCQLTEPAAIVKIEEGIRRRVEPTEVTTFFSHRSGSAFLSQLIVAPNMLKHSGQPLPASCISYDFINRLLKQIENSRRPSDAGKYQSYHLFRFGVLSLPFQIRQAS